jgi:isopentenyl diphosphate isomerase/L-lactate dehydrogenase-like FMN-dependent dehydrogenase
MASSEPQPVGELLSLLDYEAAARARMDPGAAAYVDGGAGDELTVADNVAAWRRIALRPRMLVGAGSIDPSTTLLGVSRAHPIIVAPTAFQGLAHPDGEIGIARGAAETDTIMTVSTLASTGVARLAEAVPDAVRWYQVYAFTDRGVTMDLIDRAQESGYEALVVTVDRPVLGVREREARADVRGARAGSAEPDPRVRSPDAGVRPADYSSLIDPDLRWCDIEAIAAASPLPVIVKGILTAEDAELAVAHGARGLVVSNHGGRQLDTVLSGADALGPIAEAVDGRIDVIVDGGVRRGTDVVKALALGARAVMVGRPLTWGLAMGGAQGARRVLEILIAETVNALALCGCPRAVDLHRGFVTAAPWVTGR